MKGGWRRNFGLFGPRRFGLSIVRAEDPLAQPGQDLLHRRPPPHLPLQLRQRNAGEEP